MKFLTCIPGTRTEEVSVIPKSLVNCKCHVDHIHFFLVKVHNFW